jgi:menaquinol-cytochrome c reductase iron-sulfur subunit
MYMGVLGRLWRWVNAAPASARVAHTDSDPLGLVDDEEHGVPPSPERRRFLARMGIVSGGVATLVASVPVLGVLFSPLLRREEHTWRAVGAVEEFRIGHTVKVTFVDPQPLPWAGFAGRSAAWLRRDGADRFVCFSIYCTHTGCPVLWQPSARLFLCPCHGGAFYQDGTVAAGPPPRPLTRLGVRVRDGRVEVGTEPVPLPSQS